MAKSAQQPAQPASSNRSPEVVFRYGAVSASVFVDEAKGRDGNSFRVRHVVFQRTYRDDSGNFKTTNRLDTGDLPKAVLALQDAYRHCLTGSKSEREPGEEG